MTTQRTPERVRPRPAGQRPPRRLDRDTERPHAVPGERRERRVPAAIVIFSGR